VWNNKDSGPRSARTLDLRALLPPEEQRQFAKVVIGAFLESTLHDKREYLPLFRDHRTAGHWLPKTMYITRFEESGYAPLAEFDEDIDLTTGSVPGVRLMGDSLQNWKEGVLPLRSRNDDQRHSAVWLGWNNRIGGPDTTKVGKPGTYTITLSDSLIESRHLGPNSAIYLALTATKDKPGPRSPPRDTTKKEPPDTSKAGKARADSIRADSIKKAKAAPKPPKGGEVDTIPIELTVELMDAAGNVARLPLSRFGPIRRPLETHIYRRPGRDESRFATVFELVPQTFVLALSDFVDVSPEFSPARLKSIKLVFDKTLAGTVVLTDIGTSTPVDPLFLAARWP
jgi:hypothetical protein